MAKLMNSQKQILLSDLQIADQMWSRMKGLLGTKDLSENSGLWLNPGNSIHTYFMKYAIDCVFLNSKLEIRKLVRNVEPGKLILPIWGARSVIEMKSGSIEKLGLQVGEQLHVGT
jgi:uncharacterized membrane protein (UPF0127 family)